MPYITRSVPGESSERPHGVSNTLISSMINLLHDEYLNYVSLNASMSVALSHLHFLSLDPDEELWIQVMQ